MRKNYIFLVTLVACLFFKPAISQTSMNAGSNAAQLNNQHYEYSIGEMTIVTTVKTPEITLTQGFHQPHLIIENYTESEIVKGSPFLEDLKVYPNPTENILFIEFISTETSAISYQLYDAASRMIINKYDYQRKGINKFSIDLTSFAAGTYFLIIKNDVGNETPVNYTYKIQKVQ